MALHIYIALLLFLLFIIILLFLYFFRNSKNKIKQKLVVQKIDLLKFDLIDRDLSDVIYPFNAAFLNFNWFKGVYQESPNFQRIRFKVTYDPVIKVIRISDISATNLVIKDSNKIELFVQAIMDNNKRHSIKKTLIIKNQLHPIFKEEIIFKKIVITTDIQANIKLQVINSSHSKVIGQSNFSIDNEERIEQSYDLILVPELLLSSEIKIKSNKNIRNGALCIGISIQNKLDRINIEILNLQIIDEAMDFYLYYIQVALFKNSKLFKYHSTKTSYSNRIFSFQSSIKFFMHRAVDNYDLNNMDLLIRIKDKLNEMEVSRILLGNQTNNEMCKEFWKEIQNHPDNTIIKWLPIKINKLS